MRVTARRLADNPTLEGLPGCGSPASIVGMKITDSDSIAGGMVVHADEGEHLWHLSSLVTVKARARDTDGVLGVVEGVAPPGWSPPLHLHHDEDEAMYVLEGSITIACGARRYRAETGTFVFLPHGVAHTYRVEGDRPARALVFLLPGGYEEFFVACGRPASQPRLPEPAEADLTVLDAARERHHVEIVGPPLVD
jgi:quercetin dioxygenase-like cupin family protein